MNNSTTGRLLSSPIAPMGVYDIDRLRHECEAIRIQPTRPNLRRMRRAIDLLHHRSTTYLLVC